MNNQIATAWQGLFSDAPQSPPASPTPFSSSPISSPDHPADPSARSADASPSVADYALDVPRGLAAGTEGFFKSIGGLANSVGEATGLGDAFDPESINNRYFHTKTLVGSMTSGITQFMWGFVPGLNIARGVGLAGKAASLAAGAASSFVGFNEHQDRLSNLIQEYPALQNPITNFLQAKPDDNWAEGRLKNALEGLGLGAVQDGFISAIKSFRGMGTAVAEGDASAFKAASEEGQTAVQTHLDSVPETAPTPPLGEAPGTVTPTAQAGEAVDASTTHATPELTDKISSVIQDYMKSGDDVITAATKGVQTFVNYAKNDIPKQGNDLLKIINSVMDSVTQGNVGGVLSLKDASEMAQRFASTYGIDASTSGMIAQDATNIKGMGVRLLSYEIHRNLVIDQLASMASQGVAGITPASGERVTSLLTYLADFHTNLQSIQTEGARIPSLQRVVTQMPKYDTQAVIDLAKKTVSGELGPVQQQQALVQLTQAAKDPGAFTRFLMQMDAPGQTLVKKAAGVGQALWFNSMLSSIPHFAAVMASHTINLGLQPLERAVGGLVSGDFAAMKQGYTLAASTASSAVDLFKSLNIADSTVPSPLTSSVKALWSDSAVIDRPVTPFVKPISGEAFGVGGTPMGSAIDVAGKVVDIPSRLTMSLSNFVKSMAAVSHLKMQAVDAAEQAGISGDPEALKSFIGNFVTKSFDPETGILQNSAALDYGRQADFSSPLMQGSLGKWLETGAQNHPVIRAIFPFVKTPVNIASRMVQYTPGINFMNKEFRAAWASPDAGVAATARGRFYLGGMFWTAATTAAMGGMITGEGPKNAAERNALLATGWQPHSFVKTNDDGTKEYYSFNRLDPAGMLLGLAADYSESSAHLGDDDLGGIAAAMTMAVAKNLASKTYLRGLSSVVNALGDPDRSGAKLIQSYVSSMVPSFIGQVDQDGYLRETRGLLDSVMAKIPGSASLPPRRNLFGEPITPAAGWLPFGASGTASARALSPIAYSKSVDDDVKNEMARLKAGFDLPPTKYQGLDLTALKSPTGQDAYDRLMELHGQVHLGSSTLPQSLSDLIHSKYYQNLPEPDGTNQQTNPKVMAIQKILSDYRGAAMHQVTKEYPAINEWQRNKQADMRRSSSSPLLDQLTK